MSENEDEYKCLICGVTLDWQWHVPGTEHEAVSLCGDPQCVAVWKFRLRQKYDFGEIPRPHRCLCCNKSLEGGAAYEDSSSSEAFAFCWFCAGRFCNHHPPDVFLDQHIQAYIKNTTTYMKDQLKRERLYAMREKAREVRGRTIIAMFKCVDCHKDLKYFEVPDGVCRKCQNKRLEIINKEIDRKTDLSKYQEKMAFCDTGVCDILHQHHERLIDDPERLTTEFMLNMVCGEEGVKIYTEKRKERL